MTASVKHFMKEHFNNMILRPPLFYSWKYGIRFEISMPGTEHEDRSTGIFNQVFQDTDEVLFITDISCEKYNTFLRKRPINVYRKYVKNKDLLKKLQHSVLPHIFEEEDDGDYDELDTHRFILPCTKSDIRYLQLLVAISYEDFPHPTQILRRNMAAGYDIYFVNVTRKMIYHLYDDRGCDVIAANKEDLRPLYKECNEWILDYDREQIDLLF